jgi:hypothetical protein
MEAASPPTMQKKENAPVFAGAFSLNGVDDWVTSAVRRPG